MFLGSLLTINARSRYMHELFVARFNFFFESTSQLDISLLKSTAGHLVVGRTLRLFFMCSISYQTSTQAEPEVVDISLLLRFRKRLFFFRRRCQWQTHVRLAWVTGLWAFINRSRIIFSGGWLAARATWLRKEKI